MNHLTVNYVYCEVQCLKYRVFELIGKTNEMKAILGLPQVRNKMKNTTIPMEE